MTQPDGLPVPMVPGFSGDAEAESLPYFVVVIAHVSAWIGAAEALANAVPEGRVTSVPLQLATNKLVRAWP